MKIGFWNVERLSDGTDKDRKAAIKKVFRGISPDYALFCELTTQCKFPKPWPLTYRKQSSSLLCYGCLDKDLDDIVLEAYLPDVTDDYRNANRKGGTDFRSLADRAVGHLGNVAGVEVFVIHAPAGSSSAQKAVAFLACHLNYTYKNKAWLVIGDLNVEPEDLVKVPVGIDLSGLILNTGEKTHIGKLRRIRKARRGEVGLLQGRDTELDYALCNFKNNARIARIRCSPRHHGSDHYPIVVEF